MIISQAAQRTALAYRWAGYFYRFPAVPGRRRRPRVASGFGLFGSVAHRACGKEISLGRGDIDVLRLRQEGRQLRDGGLRGGAVAMATWRRRVGPGSSRAAPAALQAPGRRGGASCGGESAGGGCER